MNERQKREREERIRTFKEARTWRNQQERVGKKGHKKNLRIRRNREKQDLQLELTMLEKNKVEEQIKYEKIKRDTVSGITDFNAHLERIGKTYKAYDPTKPPSDSEPVEVDIEKMKKESYYYLNEIKKRKKEEKVARKDREHRRRKIMLDQQRIFKALEQRQEKNTILKKILRQSQSERILANQLNETKKWKEVIRKNRLYRESQYRARKEKDVEEQKRLIAHQTELLDAQRREKMKEIQKNFEEQVMAKTQRKREKHVNFCKQVTSDLVDFCSKELFLREATEGKKPTVSDLAEWKCLFLKGDSLFQELDEEYTKKVEQENEDSLFFFGGTAEKMRMEAGDEEDALLEAMDIYSFQNYHKYKLDWNLQNILKNKKKIEKSSEEEKEPRAQQKSLEIYGKYNPSLVEVLNDLHFFLNPIPDRLKEPPVKYTSTYLHLAILGKPFTGKRALISKLSKKYRLKILNPIEIMRQEFSYGKVKNDQRTTNEEYELVLKKSKLCLMKGQTLPDEFVADLLVHQIRLVEVENEEYKKLKISRSASTLQNDSSMLSMSGDLKLQEDLKKLSRIEEQFEQGQQQKQQQDRNHVDEYAIWNGWIIEGIEMSAELSRLLEEKVSGFEYINKHARTIHHKSKLLNLSKKEFPDTQIKKLNQKMEEYEKKNPEDGEETGEEEEEEEEGETDLEDEEEEEKKRKELYPFRCFDHVYCLDVPNDEVFKRSAGQFIDPRTYKKYHLTYSPEQPSEEVLGRLKPLDEHQIDHVLLHRQLIHFSKNKRELKRFYLSNQKNNKNHEEEEEEESNDEEQEQEQKKMKICFENSRDHLRGCFREVDAVGKSPDDVFRYFSDRIGYMLENGREERREARAREEKAEIEAREAQRVSQMKEKEEKRQKELEDQLQRQKAAEKEQTAPKKSKEKKESARDRKRRLADQEKREARETQEREVHERKAHIRSVLSLHPDSASHLEKIWYDMEPEYMSLVKKILRRVRYLRKTFLHRAFLLKQEFARYLLEKDDRQKLYDDFMRLFNSVEEDKRNEEVVKNELHQRVSEFREKLWQVTDKRREEAIQKIENYRKEKWMGIYKKNVTKGYFELIGLEGNKFVHTAKFLEEYFREKFHCVPETTTTTTTSEEEEEKTGEETEEKSEEEVMEKYFTGTFMDLENILGGLNKIIFEPVEATSGVGGGSAKTSGGKSTAKKSHQLKKVESTNQSLAKLSQITMDTTTSQNEKLKLFVQQVTDEAMTHTAAHPTTIPHPGGLGRPMSGGGDTGRGKGKRERRGSDSMLKISSSSSVNLLLEDDDEERKEMEKKIIQSIVSERELLKSRFSVLCEKYDVTLSELDEYMDYLFSVFQNWTVERHRSEMRVIDTVIEFIQEKIEVEKPLEHLDMEENEKRIPKSALKCIKQENLNISEDTIEETEEEEQMKEEQEHKDDDDDEFTMNQILRLINKFKQSCCSSSSSSKTTTTTTITELSTHSETINSRKRHRGSMSPIDPPAIKYTLEQLENMRSGFGGNVVNYMDPKHFVFFFMILTDSSFGNLELPRRWMECYKKQDFTKFAEKLSTPDFSRVNWKEFMFNVLTSHLFQTNEARDDVKLPSIDQLVEKEKLYREKIISGGGQTPGTTTPVPSPSSANSSFIIKKKKNAVKGSFARRKFQRQFGVLREEDFFAEFSRLYFGRTSNYLVVASDQQEEEEEEGSQKKMRVSIPSKENVRDLMIDINDDEEYGEYDDDDDDNNNMKKKKRRKLMMTTDEIKKCLFTLFLEDPSKLEAMKRKSGFTSSSSSTTHSNTTGTGTGTGTSSSSLIMNSGSSGRLEEEEKQEEKVMNYVEYLLYCCLDDQIIKSVEKCFAVLSSFRDSKDGSLDLQDVFTIFHFNVCPSLDGGRGHSGPAPGGKGGPDMDEFSAEQIRAVFGQGRDKIKFEEFVDSPLGRLMIRYATHLKRKKLF